MIDMKEKLVVGLLVTGITFCITSFLLRDEKKKSKEPEDKIKLEEINSGRELILFIMADLLRNPEDWKNERDFLEKLTKLFIQMAKEPSWIVELPVSQDRLWKVLEEEKLLGAFEIELEKKYRKNKKDRV